MKEERDITTTDVYKAHTSFLDYLKLAWPEPQPLSVGRHVRECCELLTSAVTRHREFQGTLLVVDMPPRHGKSTIFTYAFPAWFVAMTKRLYLVERHADSAFLDGNIDRYLRSPIQIAMRGTEYRPMNPALLVVDDILNPVAESCDADFRDAAHRRYLAALERVDENAVVVVVASRCHKDDLVGRILADPAAHMPRGRDAKFVHASFPARKEGPGGWETLFPERFAADWYLDQRRSLGTERAAALLDQAPVAKPAAPCSGCGKRCAPSGRGTYPSQAERKRERNKLFHEKRMKQNADRIRRLMETEAKEGGEA